MTPFTHLFRRALALIGAAAFAWSAAAAQDGQVLQYERADLRAVINDVATFTGRTFVVDPAVAGKVTVYSTEPLTPAGIWEVFVATLSVAGYSAVPTREGFYKILPLASAAREPGMGLGEEADANEAFITRVFRLDRADARETAANVKPLLSPEGVLSALVSENAIVIADTSGRVARVAEIIEKLDFDRIRTETVTLDNLSAGEATRILREALGAKQEGARRGLSITAAPAVNAVILRGSETEIADGRELLHALDRRSSARNGVDVVFLIHADAEELSTALEPLLGAGIGGGGGEGTQVGVASSSVAAYAPANALIIVAEAEQRAVIKSIAERLDVRRPQVRVEAIIVEVQDDFARDLGIDIFAGGDDILFGTNYSRTAPTLLTAAGSVLLASEGDDGVPVEDALATAALQSVVGVPGAFLGGLTLTEDGNVFGALLDALETDTESNILSTPSILTLDNQPARFQVGQEIPIVTGSSLGDANINPFTTVQREDIGTVLEVTPQINDGETVTLQIRQEVSSIFGTTTTTNDIILDKREIETTVVASSGEIIILGGLIDETENRSESEIPLLGDIPLLGRLFQARSRQVQKRNLMVLLRPIIIRDDTDARRVTSQMYNYVNADALLQGSGDETRLDRYIDGLLGEGESERLKNFYPNPVEPSAPAPETDGENE